MNPKDAKTGRFDELRRRAEEFLRRCPPTAEGGWEAGHLIEQLNLYQAELTLQNEELQGAQATIEFQRRKYFQLFDLAPMGFVTLDPNGVIHEINLQASEMLGIARHLVHSGLTPMAAFISGESHNVFHRHLNEAFSRAGPAECDLELQLRRTEPMIVRMRSATIGADKPPRLCLAGLLDVTALIKGERKLRTTLDERNAVVRDMAQTVQNHLRDLVALVEGLRTEGKQDPAMLLGSLQRKMNLVATVFDKVHQPEQFPRVGMQELLSHVVHTIRNLLCPADPVTVAIDAGRLTLPCEQALDCALLVGELVENALRHGRGDDVTSPTAIAIRLGDDGPMVTLTVTGPRGSFAREQYSTSAKLGVTWINRIVRRLEGRLEFGDPHFCEIVIRWRRSRMATPVTITLSQG